MCDWNDLKFCKRLVMQDQIAKDIEKSHLEIDTFCTRINVGPVLSYPRLELTVFAVAGCEH